MPTALEIAQRRAAEVAQRNEARGLPTRFDSLPGAGTVTCAECKHGHMRVGHVGITTIYIGKPSMRCLVDGRFRSPEIQRGCTHFERKGTPSG